MNTFFNKLIILIVSGLFFIGCQKEVIVKSKYELDKAEIKEKIDLAKLNSVDLRFLDDIDFTYCGISVENCFKFKHGLQIYVDISDCSIAVTDSCLIYGEMIITICNYDNENMEVNFKESLWGHSNSCITNEIIHTDDWDCIAEKTYLSFVDYLMPIILDLWGIYNDCEKGYNTTLSTYTKELCTYPCTFRKGSLYYSQLVQCGNSTACCVKKDTWCKDKNGVIHSTPGDIVQIGTCSFGEIPCKPGKSELFPVLDHCRPRKCINIKP